MTDFLIGIVLGGLLTYSLSGVFKKRKPAHTHEWKLHIPNYLHRTISETGNHFKWNAVETMREIIKLGLFALLLYKKDEGGLCTLNNTGTPMLMKIEDTESIDDGDIGPFIGFINELDLD